MELAPGSVLAGYRLGRVVSRTKGVHTVYEAGNAAGERVAVKLISRGLGQNRRFRDRFEQLLAKRSAIQHPHLLPLLDRGEFVDVDVPGTTCLYVVSRFVAAPTLSELLDRRPPDRDTALRLLGQIADGLDAAHAAGLVHPNLTPSDIVIVERRGGHALVTDFLGEPAREGSRSYRSPESGRGQGLTAASDVYSLTLILAECLTGKPPRRTGLPDGLDPVVARGTARDPTERYPTCAALVAAAAGALDGVTSPRAVPEPLGAANKARLAWEPQEKQPGERRRLPTPRFTLAALAIGAVLGAGVGAIAEGGDESSPAPSRGQVPERSAAKEQAAVVQRATPAVDRLLGARAAGRRRIARARTPAGQALAAAAIGRQYAVAARQLESAGAEAVALAARRGASAYDRLAAAARSGERIRWRAASRSVRRADTALARELLEFGGRAPS